MWFFERTRLRTKYKHCSLLYSLTRTARELVDGSLARGRSELRSRQLGTLGSSQCVALLALSRIAIKSRGTDGSTQLRAAHHYMIKILNLKAASGSTQMKLNSIAMNIYVENVLALTRIIKKETNDMIFNFSWQCNNGNYDRYYTSIHSYILIW